MLYIKLIIEREKNTGQSAPECPFNPLIAALKPQSNGPSYGNTVIGTLAVGGWVVTFGTARTEEGTERGRSLPRPLLAVPNVIAHPSTASVQLRIRPIRSVSIIVFGV